MKKTIISIITALSFSAMAKTSYVSKSHTLQEAGSQIELSTTYFKTQRRVDVDVKEVEITDGESFQTMDFDFRGAYGFTNQFEVGIGLRGRSNFATVVDGEETTNKTNSGLESGSLHLNYSWTLESGNLLGVEANYRNSFYTNELININDKDQLVVLGDGGSSISIGPSFSIVTASQNYFTTLVLYRKPSEELSSEIYSEVEFSFMWPSFSLIFGVENNYSLKGDEYTNEPGIKPAVNTGPSNLYNSVNRGWTAPYMGMNFALGKFWRVELQGSYVATGKSTDLGPKIYMGLFRRKSKDKFFKKKDSAFKQYRIEGDVSKVSSSGKSVIINKGIADGIEKGMKVDFFYFDFLGGNELIATGYAIKVSATKSMVKLTKRYSKKRKVKEGTVARSGIYRN